MSAAIAGPEIKAASARLPKKLFMPHPTQLQTHRSLPGCEGHHRTVNGIETTAVKWIVFCGSRVVDLLHRWCVLTAWLSVLRAVSESKARSRLRLLVVFTHPGSRRTD